MQKTILVADDDRTLVHSLSVSLEKEGYHVVAAYDGAEAVRKVQEQMVDLIILDIQMPRINGYSFLFELPKIDGRRHIPIIVLTSNTDMADIFIAEGVKEYLVKPCAMKDIIEKIKKYVV